MEDVVFSTFVYYLLLYFLIENSSRWLYNSRIFNTRRRTQRHVMRIRSGRLLWIRDWSKRWRIQRENTLRNGSSDRVSASSEPCDAVGRDVDAITIRLSPSVVLLQSGYQLSNPLISVHSIYVRLSSLMDRREDNDLPVWESTRRCIVNASARGLREQVPRIPCRS